jgi:hypothetical protein
MKNMSILAGARTLHPFDFVILLYGNPHLILETTMEYKGFTIDQLPIRQGAMEILRKPSLIGGNLYKSVFAEKQQECKQLAPKSKK